MHFDLGLKMFQFVFDLMSRDRSRGIIISSFRAKIMKYKRESRMETIETDL